jgi:hypothetical protein
MDMIPHDLNYRVQWGGESGHWHEINGVYRTLSLCLVSTAVDVYFKMGVHICKCTVFHNNAFII